MWDEKGPVGSGLALFTLPSILDSPEKRYAPEELTCRRGKSLFSFILFGKNLLAKGKRLSAAACSHSLKLRLPRLLLLLQCDYATVVSSPMERRGMERESDH